MYLFIYLFISVFLLIGGSKCLSFLWFFFPPQNRLERRRFFFFVLFRFLKCNSINAGFANNTSAILVTWCEHIKCESCVLSLQYAVRDRQCHLQAPKRKENRTNYIQFCGTCLKQFFISKLDRYSNCYILSQLGRQQRKSVMSCNDIYATEMYLQSFLNR